MRILLDDDLEKLIVKHTYEEANSQLGILADLIGLFSDPIASILSPIIKLWELEIERSKIKILHEQLRDRTELHKKMIDARVYEVSVSIQQRKYEIDIVVERYREQFKNSDRFISTSEKTLDRLFALIAKEKNHDLKLYQHRLIEIVHNNLSTDMNKTADGVYLLMKQVITTSDHLIKQLNS